MDKEETKYKKARVEVYNPLIDEIDTIKEREIKVFFQTILDAAERAFRGILFMTPKEFNFKKEITKEEMDFWLRKVSLALISYSYYFYDNHPIVKENKTLADTVDIIDKVVWGRIFNYYNQIFNEDINQEEIDYYASGLKEDTEEEYTKSGNMEKVLELTDRDYKTIASELLQKIWNEDINDNEKKGLILGVRIWQAHQQLVQPFLVELLNM